jgi:hypothetical protein
MAVLLFTAPSSSSTPLLDQVTDVTVTTTLDEAWGITYTNPSWSFYPPTGSSATLSPGNASPENPQSFTPDVPGNYLVLASVDEVSPGVLTGVRLSSLYSVSPAEVSAGRLPASFEKNEADPLGWAVGMNSYAEQLGIKSNGVHQTVINLTGGAISAGTIVKFDSSDLHGWAGPGGTPQDTGKLVAPITSAFANVAGAESEVMGIVLSTIGDNSLGTILIAGALPYNSAALSVGSRLYLQDGGGLGVTTGTKTRALGVVKSQGPATGANPGFVLFNGMPGSNGAVVGGVPSDGDTLVYSAADASWLPSAPVTSGYTNRRWFVQSNAGLTTMSEVGIASTTFTSGGASTNVTDSDGTFRKATLKVAAGSAMAGLETHTAYTRSITRPDHKPTLHVTGKYTDVGGGDFRLWAGCFSADPVGSATPAVSYAAFRYAQAVDGTAFWRTVTDSGTGTPEVTVTTAAVATDTIFKLKIKFDTSDIKFYVDDVLVATHSGTIPAPSTVMNASYILERDAGSDQHELLLSIMAMEYAN